MLDHWWPMGLYTAMFNIAQKHSTVERPLGAKEVSVTIVREWLKEHTGFECRHPEERIKIDKEEEGYPTIGHCTYCWTRFEVIKKRGMKRNVNEFTVVPGKYREIKPPMFEEWRDVLQETLGENIEV
jgi:hypothetical protein